MTPSAWRTGDPFVGAFATSPVAMAVCGTDGVIEHVNDAFSELVQRSHDQLAGHDLRDLLGPLDGTDDPEVWASVVEGTRAVALTRTTLAPGHDEVVELTATLRGLGPNGEARLVVQLDPSPESTDALGRHIAHLRAQALHDPLTGLPTRPLLMDRIRAARHRARRHHEAFACLFVDLDRFKSINDTYGHSVGDRVLVDVVDRARRRIRSQDTFSRLGGDEFVIVVEELDRENTEEPLQELCGELLELLREPMVVDGTTVALSASIGVVTSAGRESPEDLLHAADVAMYEAKAAGRDRWRMHSPGMATPGSVRHSIRELLGSALDEHRIAILHQPVIDLRDGTAVGVEAFARLIHADGTFSQPRLFIPVAESTGMIHQLGEVVLRAAAASARGGVGWIAVNVSPRQLAEPNFAHVVLAALEDNELAPQRVVFDITGSEDLEVDDHAAVSNLRRLHEQGIRFALDDFGRGASSLHRFRNLPVSFIKLDQSFVDGVANVGSGDIAVVRAVLGLAASMDVPVIAEGVETALQQRILRQIGVPLAQGYLFARPAPPIPT